MFSVYIITNRESSSILPESVDKYKFDKNNIVQCYIIKE